MKDRIKSASFWATAIGAVFLMLSAFGVDIGGEVQHTVINAVCSVLVVLGIITVPGKKTDEPQDSEIGNEKTSDLETPEDENE